MLIISRAAGWWDYWRSVCVLGILCPFVHFSNPDKSGSGLRQGVGQDEDGWGAGLASGRLTFSPGADTWIDSLCHGSVIHSCLSFTHTHTHTDAGLSKQTVPHTSTWSNNFTSATVETNRICSDLSFNYSSSRLGLKVFLPIPSRMQLWTSRRQTFRSWIYLWPLYTVCMYVDYLQTCA